MLTTALIVFVAAAPPAKSKELLEKGRQAFMTNCMACHGEKGAGDGPGAVALNPKPRNYQKDPFKQGDKPEDIFKTLQTGVPNTAMVGFGHLSEEDRWALTYWVLELKGTGTPAAAPVPDAGTKAPEKAAPKKK